MVKIREVTLRKIHESIRENPRSAQGAFQRHSIRSRWRGTHHNLCLPTTNPMQNAAHKVLMVVGSLKQNKGDLGGLAKEKIK